MRSLCSLRRAGLRRALARRRASRASATGYPLPASRAVRPTVYADAPLARVLTAVDRHGPDLDRALADYARARRAAGVRPETVIVELKRVLGRAGRLDLFKTSSPASGDGARSVLAGRLTHRLIELYFAA